MRSMMMRTIMMIFMRHRMVSGAPLYVAPWADRLADTKPNILSSSSWSLLANVEMIEQRKHPRSYLTCDTNQLMVALKQFSEMPELNSGSRWIGAGG